MRILHVSDFHKKIGTDFDQNIVIDAFFEHISKNKSDFEHIDLVVFSGDLVQSGDAEHNFAKFKSEVIDVIASKLSLTRDRFVLCPGNHDIDRNVVRREDYVELGLREKFKTRDDINRFIDSNVGASFTNLPTSLARLQNFYNEIWGAGSGSALKTTPFYRVQKIAIGALQIGVVSLNSAWRTTGEKDDVDFAKLIIGERSIDLALSELGSCDLRFAVFHHPLDWLLPVDRQAVEGRLFAEFDMMFYGHVHEAQPEMKRSTLGEAVLSQGACLYSSRDWFNGYSIIDIDIAEGRAEFSVFEYIDKRRVFRPAERISDSGKFLATLPSHGKNSEAATLSRLIRSAGAAVRAQAVKHINLAGLDASEMDLERHYKCPPLSEQSEATSRLGDAGIGADSSYLDVAEILQATDNFAINGRPQDGKTSLAHFLAYKCASSVSDVPRLPMIGSFENIPQGRPSAWKTALWPIVKNYASEILETVSRSTVENSPLLVIVDDVDIYDEKRMDMLKSLMANYKNVRWFFIVRSDIVSISIEAKIRAVLPGTRLFGIGDLTHGQIRALSAGWLNKETEDERTSQLYNNVMSHIRRTGLPRTGYIVSLLLWVLEHRFDGELLNEAVLLGNVLDYILGRMDYRGALRSEFDFTSKTSVLQEISYWLKMADGSKTKNEVTAFVIDFLQRRSLAYDGASIVNSFIACGVLEDADGYVKFKFRRFQDFFVAGYLRDNQSARDKVLQGGDNWLEFRREIDIYTSRYRQEVQFLNVAFSELEQKSLGDAFPSDTEADRFLEGGPPSNYTSAQLNKMRSKRMTAKQIDSIMDRAERRATTRQAESPTGRTAERYRDPKLQLASAAFGELLRIYSEVIRNLEFIETDDKLKHIRISIKSWSQLTLFWIKSFKEALSDVKDDFFDDEDMPLEVREKIPEILSWIESIVKVVLSSTMSKYAFDSIGTEKIINLIEDIVKEEAISRMERFVIFSIVLEMDPRRALNMLRNFGPYRELDNWTIGAVSQRLYGYYNSRPLPDALSAEFENVVAELEMVVKGAKPSQRNVKSKILLEIKKNQFRDGV